MPTPGSATSFTYINSGTIVPLPAGIKKFGLKRSTKTVGLLKFSVTGKNGSYAWAITRDDAQVYKLPKADVITGAVDNFTADAIINRPRDGR